MVDDRAGMLDHLVAASDRLVQHVRLKVVAVQPGLADVDRWVSQHLGAENAEAIGGIGDESKGQHAEDKRVEAGSQRAAARRALDAAPLAPARALKVVGAHCEQSVKSIDELG